MFGAIYVLYSIEGSEQPLFQFTSFSQSCARLQEVAPVVRPSFAQIGNQSTVKLWLNQDVFFRHFLLVVIMCAKDWLKRYGETQPRISAPWKIQAESPEVANQDIPLSTKLAYFMVNLKTMGAGRSVSWSSWLPTQGTDNVVPTGCRIPELAAEKLM